MDNIWKTILIAPNYLISNNGKVKNKISGKILKLRYDKDGYLKVQLSTPLKKQKNFFVHRLVANAFLSSPNNLPVVNHKDENRANNNVDNLEWCTIAYNNAYGTHNEKVKKTNQEKYGKKIKARKDNKEYLFFSVKEAARVLNVSYSNIFACLKGRLKTTGGYIFEEGV